MLDGLDGGIGQRTMLSLLDRLNRGSFNVWHGGQRWKMTMLRLGLMRFNLNWFYGGNLNKYWEKHCDEGLSLD